MIPKISVVVPVYNVESYLGRCVDSILEQTYQDFEIMMGQQTHRENWVIVMQRSIPLLRLSIKKMKGSQIQEMWVLRVQGESTFTFLTAMIILSENVWKYYIKMP